MSNLKASSAVFCLIVAIDQLLKWLVVKYQAGFQLGWISLEAAINPGIIFGNLANANPLVRTIFFSCFFILVLFIAAFIQFYFLRETRYKSLSLSLAVFVAGISGNAFDRIRLGYAIDYLRFPIAFFGGYILNFADVMQLAGALLSLFFLFRLRHDLWPIDDERGFSLIDSRYQLAFSFKMAFISFFSMLMTGTFSYAFLKVYLPVFEVQLQSVFLVSWLVIGLLLVVFAFLFGLILSSRTVGPIYALERFIKALKRGESAQLRLRQLDSFKQLETLAEEIRELTVKKREP
ncbi:MAG: signal peptidase II [Deltaproteobacteria bacterium]|nr:signal peptidase II [Deltaproteobacteria bacterium]